MKRRPIPEVVRLRQRSEVIAECLAANMRAEAIAERLGLSVPWTKELVRRAKGEKPGSNGTKWTSDEDDQLRAMWRRVPRRQIEKKLGRGRDSVLGRAYRLGLMRKGRKGGVCTTLTLDEEARRKPTLPRLKCLEKVWE